MMKEIKANIINRIKANFSDAKEKNDFAYNRLDLQYKKKRFHLSFFI